MNTFFTVLKFVAISLLAGYLSMLLQREPLEVWYPMLRKSSLTPPGYVFAIVWSFLYVLMGVSVALVSRARTNYSWVLVLLFYLQLLLNLMWSFCFFFLKMPLLALVVLIALLLCVAAYVSGAYARHRWASLLNVPYLLWLLFAAYLNGYVVLFN